jgi:uncharacterized protein YggE
VVTEPGRRTITVRGHGRAEIPPDEAEVVLGVEIVRPTAGEARTEAATVMARVLEALGEAGLAPDDIRTSELSLGAEVEYRPDGPPRRAGFRLTNRVTARVGRPGGVAEVVDAAVGAGATTLDGVQFRVRDESEARRGALESAVADARTTAETVAAAAGARLGPVRTIREAADVGMPPMPRLARMELKAADTPMAPGLSRIEASIEVTWDLEP